MRDPIKEFNDSMTVVGCLIVATGALFGAIILAYHF